MERNSLYQLNLLNLFVGFVFVWIERDDIAVRVGVVVVVEVKSAYVRKEIFVSLVSEQSPNKKMSKLTHLNSSSPSLIVCTVYKCTSTLYLGQCLASNHNYLIKLPTSYL